MTDTDWAIQVSPRVGDTLINLRAKTGDEMLAILGWYEQNSASIASALGAGAAGVAVAQTFPGSTNVQPVAEQLVAAQQAPPPVWGHQSQQAPPQWSQPAPAAPQGPQPSCAHGAMQYRESKPGAGKAWKAYFCPTPKGTQGQCEPQWIKG